MRAAEEASTRQENSSSSTIVDARPRPVSASRPSPARWACHETRTSTPWSNVTLRFAPGEQAIKPSSLPLSSLLALPLTLLSVLASRVMLLLLLLLLLVIDASELTKEIVSRF